MFRSLGLIINDYIQDLCMPCFRSDLSKTCEGNTPVNTHACPDLLKSSEVCHCFIF